MATGFEHDVNCNIPSPTSPRSVAASRRCSYCHKMVFFKVYRCKHCKHRCHKKCAGPSHKQHAGEEHWTKVLQANEVNSNMVLARCQCGGSKRRGSHSCCDKSRKSRHGVTDQEEKDRNIFAHLYNRFCQWVASNKKDSASESGCSSRTPRHSSRSRSRSRSNSTDTRGGSEVVSYDQMYNAEALYRCLHASLSSEDSDVGSLLQSYSSVYNSSWTLISTSTTTSDFQRSYMDSGQTSPTVDKNSQHGVLSEPPFFYRMYSYKMPEESKSPVTHTRSDHIRTKHASMSTSEGSNTDRSSLYATWPPAGQEHHAKKGSVRRLDSTDHEEDEEEEEAVFPDWTSDDEDNSDDEHREGGELLEPLGDFSIPFSDLKLGERVRVGRQHDIYRGRWHGEVMIHAYRGLSEQEVSEFWDEVNELCMITHENVALFMGACVDPPNLAVVSSQCKGCSLYELIHLKAEKTSGHARISTARQVAQGMGYLHAKGIVLRKLNSRNVYLEPKVKLCLMDYGMADKRLDRPNYGCIPRGQLTYVAPEILRTLRVVCPSVEATAEYTRKTDVFAFGTLFYEILSGRFPLTSTPAEGVIWQVSSGKRQPVRPLKCNMAFKDLIRRCWTQDPTERPAFADINKLLHANAALHKKRSSSDPERIHSLGVAQGCIFS